ncbi:MAG: cytochrome c3 family protein [Acidobacteriota bacterium]
MIAWALLLAAAAAGPSAACTLCHPAVRVEFEQGVHRREGVTCVSCHGGDPGAVSVEAAHRGAFRGVPRRRDIPKLCASCHADIALMRPYNLPADQYALYETSRHGLLLAQGNERVAVCTDCHGAHEIRRPDDPRSSVFRRNIPRTCARCHADPSRMGGTGPRDDPYRDYAEGVHGRAFLTRDNLSAPDCSSCHGAHGAAPPGFGDIDKVCGQCHATTRAYFLEGPHYAAMREAGLPECASCHDHHRIGPADLSALDSACVACHEEGSDQLEVAAAMRTLFTAAAEEIDRARALVERAAAIPLYVGDYEAGLEDARTALMESFPVMHSLDVQRVQDFTLRARSIATAIQSEIEGKLEGRAWRRVGLMLFWFYLLLTVAILVRFRRRAAAEALR